MPEEPSRSSEVYLRSSALICGLFLLLSACTRQPEAYAPPAQIALPSGPEPAIAISSEPLIAMSDPDIAVHVIADMFPADPTEEWRFTGLHPRFRIQLQHAAPFDFYTRFDNSVESIRDFGPVSFTVTINGHRFESQRFMSGAQEYRHTLPEGWITQPGPVDIAVDIGPPRRFPDGAVYGVKLHSIGLEERPACCR